jgi:hypothetical protein
MFELFFLIVIGIILYGIFSKDTELKVETKEEVEVRAARRRAESDKTYQYSHRDVPVVNPSLENLAKVISTHGKQFSAKHNRILNETDKSEEAVEARAALAMALSEEMNKYAEQNAEMEAIVTSGEYLFKQRTGRELKDSDKSVDADVARHNIQLAVKRKWIECRRQNETLSFREDI